MEPNCEKHPRIPRTYIVHDADGYAFRATRRKGYCCGAWSAVPSYQDAKGDTRHFVADTLTALCRKVAASRKDA